jgi:hypothetical protein
MSSRELPHLPVSRLLLKLFPAKTVVVGLVAMLSMSSSLLVGCSRKATVTEYVKQIQIDTIQTPVYTTTYIPVECDSAGVLKAFKYETASGPVKVSLFSDSGRVVVKLRVDTIVQRYRGNTVYREIVKTKNVVPKWVFPVILICVIFVLLTRI